MLSVWSGGLNGGPLVNSGRLPTDDDDDDDVDTIVYYNLTNIIREIIIFGHLLKVPANEINDTYH